MRFPGIYFTSFLVLPFLGTFLVLQQWTSAFSGRENCWFCINDRTNAFPVENFGFVQWTSAFLGVSSNRGTNIENCTLLQKRHFRPEKGHFRPEVGCAPPAPRPGSAHEIGAYSVKMHFHVALVPLTRPTWQTNAFPIEWRAINSLQNESICWQFGAFASEKFMWQKVWFSNKSGSEGVKWLIYLVTRRVHVWTDSSNQSLSFRVMFHCFDAATHERHTPRGFPPTRGSSTVL
jgi:hypothetical protein